MIVLRYMKGGGWSANENGKMLGFFRDLHHFSGEVGRVKQLRRVIFDDGSFGFSTERIGGKR